MADKKITELTNITGANLVDADEFVVVDISADETKAITLGELKEAFDSGSGFVRITGDTMTGDLALSGADVTFGDNDKAIFGAGSDLQIYSDGTTGQITGDVNITGTLTSDGLTVDTDAYRRLLLTYPDNFTSKLQVGFSNFYVQGSATNDRLTIANNSSGQTHFENQSKTSMVIDNSGDISFYEDTGTTPKFFWDASAESLGIGNTSPTDKLHLGTNSGGTQLKIQSGSGVNNCILYTNGTTDSWRTGMNLTLTNGSYEFYDDVNNVARMVIDSSGNVGIGTNAPYSFGVNAKTLNLNGVKGGAVAFTRGTNSATKQWALRTSDDDALRFEYGSTLASEAMRIDSSGNVMVGTTNGAPVSNNVVGISARGQYGELQVSTEGSTGAPLYLNRKTSDGIIAVFRKDGNTVGSIGVENSSDLTIGNADTGLRFVAGDDAIWPFNMSTGADRDNAVSLGVPAARFKDLYLSGTAYVDTAVEIHAGNSLKLQNVSGNGFATIQNAGAGTNTDLSFNTAGSEAMRIDSSGNLLVGKTAAGIANAGSEFSSTGRAFFTFDGGGPLQLNRKTSDGDIIELHKDGTEVGSIGVAPSNRLYIGNSDAGLRFLGDSNLITPWNPSTNSNSDNLLDLGNNANRWKDVYVGGGVYLGGTGSANKLDDYEEGTWTPDLEGSTTAGSQSGSRYGWYTKVGRNVTVYFRFVGYQLTGSSGNIRLANLPFTVNGSIYGVGNFAYIEGATPTFTSGTGNDTVIMQALPNQTYAGLQPQHATTAYDKFVTGFTFGSIGMYAYGILTYEAA